MKRRPSSPIARLVLALREAFLAPLTLYRRFISPALPARCKYYPSCSTYATQAVRELGVVRGTLLGAYRLARCNPWSKGGVDELADRRFFRGREDTHDSHHHGAPA